MSSIIGIKEIAEIAKIAENEEIAEIVDAMLNIFNFSILQMSTATDSDFQVHQLNTYFGLPLDNYSETNFPICRSTSCRYSTDLSPEEIDAQTIKNRIGEFLKWMVHALIYGDSAVTTEHLLYIEALSEAAQYIETHINEFLGKYLLPDLLKNIPQNILKRMLLSAVTILKDIKKYIKVAFITPSTEGSKPLTIDETMAAISTISNTKHILEQYCQICPIDPFTMKINLLLVYLFIQNLSSEGIPRYDNSTQRVPHIPIDFQSIYDFAEMMQNRLSIMAYSSKVTKEKRKREEVEVTNKKREEVEEVEEVEVVEVVEVVEKNEIFCRQIFFTQPTWSRLISAYIGPNSESPQP